MAGPFRLGPDWLVCWLPAPNAEVMPSYRHPDSPVADCAGPGARAEPHPAQAAWRNHQRT